MQSNIHVHEYKKKSFSRFMLPASYILRTGREVQRSVKAMAQALKKRIWEYLPIFADICQWPKLSRRESDFFANICDGWRPQEENLRKLIASFQLGASWVFKHNPRDEKSQISGCYLVWFDSKINLMLFLENTNTKTDMIWPLFSLLFLGNNYSLSKSSQHLLVKRT